jgi:hypothetical protein
MNTLYFNAKHLPNHFCSRNFKIQTQTPNPSSPQKKFNKKRKEKEDQATGKM